MKRSAIIVKIILFAFLIGIGIILTAFTLFFSLPGKEVPQTIVTSQPNIIQEQAMLEKSLLKDYASGQYTLENPYIVQDAYGNSPLTALVVFETSQPSRISVLIKGKAKYSELRYQLEETQTHHEVPIIGLYAGVTNEVELTAQQADGFTTKNTLLLKTEPLPDNLPARTLIVSKPEKMESGWTLVNTETYKFILDSDGDVRWFLRFLSNNILKVLPNGNLLVAYVPTPPYTPGDPPDKLVETNLLGKFSAMYFTPSVHHDVIPYQNSYLSTVGEAIYQFDQQTGIQIGQTLSLWDFFPTNRVYDYMDDPQSLHINALVSGGDLGDDVLISARNQHALALINYPEKTLKWIMGVPTDWPAQYQTYLLKPIGNDFEWFWMQHAPQVLPDQDKDADTIDILLFDNGTFRDFVEKAPKKTLYSRMVQYRIHQQTRTIEQIWSFGKERGFELFSSIKSNANYYPQTGNYLGTFGEVQSKFDVNRYDGVILEITRQKEPVFEVRLTDTHAIYRSERIGMGELIPKMALGQQPGKYLQNDIPYSIYGYPRVSNLTIALDYSNSLYHLCITKLGNDCLDWIYRAKWYAGIKLFNYSALRIYVDSVGMINRDIQIKGRVELPETQEKNLFLVLSNGAETFTYDISSAQFSKTGENGLSTFYVNYFNDKNLPPGEYKMTFFSHTPQGINITETPYVVDLLTLHGAE